MLFWRLRNCSFSVSIALQVFAVVILLSPSICTGAELTRLRVATWNLENFTSEAGVSLFPQYAEARAPRDLKIYQKYLFQMDADLIAFQEVSSADALKFLSVGSYVPVISRQAFDWNRRRAVDIFTGIAARRSSKWTLGSAFEIDTVLEDPSEEGAFTRSSVGISLSLSGYTLYFVSLHLKSSCSETEKLTGRTDCILLRAQAEIINNWLEKNIKAGASIILAGDFNRNIFRFSEDPFTSELLRAVRSSGTKYRIVPSSGVTGCPTRKFRIDYIIAVGEIVDAIIESSVREYIPTEYERIFGAKVSDHCGMSVDFLL